MGQRKSLLYVYNELADDARYELEQHLARCTGVRHRTEGGAQVPRHLSQVPVEEPTPNLLAASRMRLQESLETAEQGGFWRRLIFDPAAWLRQIRFSPALAAAIFMVGFGGGIGATYQIAAQPHAAAVLRPVRQRRRRSPPSPASTPSPRSRDPTRSASSTTRFRPRKRKAR